MKQSFENLESQQRYARVLQWICNVGLALMFFTFALYLFELVPSLVPLKAFPQYWNLSLQEYLEHTGAPRGWEWVHHLGLGDSLTFSGLIIFMGVTGICYLFLFADFMRANLRLFAVLVGTELVLILLAASNLLQVGH